MDDLKAQGMHPRSGPLRTLRAELKAAKALPSASGADVEVSVTPAAPAVVETVDSGLYDTEEWRFIERCVAEIPIGLQGMTSNFFKKMYGRVTLQVGLWRRMRDEYAKVGPNGEFLAFGDLGIDPTYGKPVQPKQEANGKDEPEPEPEPEGAPAVTDAQMPIRGVPGREALLNQLGGKAKFDPRMAPSEAP
jgi:hypothetical protein